MAEPMTDEQERKIREYLARQEDQDGDRTLGDVYARRLLTELDRLRGGRRTPVEQLAALLWTARSRARGVADPRPLSSCPPFTRERYLRLAEQVAELLGAEVKVTDEAAVERAILSSAEGGITARGAARAAWRLLAPPLRVLEAQLEDAAAEVERLRGELDRANARVQAGLALAAAAGHGAHVQEGGAPADQGPVVDAGELVNALGGDVS